MNNGEIVFNGINASTGRPLSPAVSAERMASLITGEDFESDEEAELRSWSELLRENDMDVAHRIDLRQLEETGWGVIFPVGVAAEVREALAPLLELRRRQAGRKKESYYRELEYRPKESKARFLARHKAGPGPANPEVLPYYLLIVASPEEIPFSFQYQLDLQYAVGRIWFASAGEYADYARSVVAAEDGEVRRDREATFFAVANPDDKATGRSLRSLARPLADELESQWPAWTFERRFGDEATKAALASAFTAERAPAVVFTASHGVAFEIDDPRQLRHQGALLCQDWPGPRQWREEIPEEHYFSADDLGDSDSLAGLLTFHFACYGAGTPELDSFGHRRGERLPIAPHDFVARLPQRLLAHPRGGALAVVGHVDRAWSYSFDWPRAGEQMEVFTSTFGRLFDGYPVGAAMEFFNQRYAELSSDLSFEMEEAKYASAREDLLSLSGLWTANNDARSFVVLGDPAVRLAVEPA